MLTKNEPSDLVVGEYLAQYVDYVLKSVVAGLGSHEHEPIEYTVSVEFQNVTFEGKESAALGETEVRGFILAICGDRTCRFRTN